MVTSWAGTLQGFDANLLLGAILIAPVLALPQGLLPTLRRRSPAGLRQ